jgi:arylformamidase
MSKLYQEIYDISPLISSELAVFPQDVSFVRNKSHCFSKGDSYSLSSINTTLHIGSHADAPSHYHSQGEDIAAQDLSRYFGPCQVLQGG